MIRTFQISSNLIGNFFFSYFFNLLVITPPGSTVFQRQNGTKMTSLVCFKLVWILEDLSVPVFEVLWPWFSWKQSYSVISKLCSNIMITTQVPLKLIWTNLISTTIIYVTNFWSFSTGFYLSTKFHATNDSTKNTWLIKIFQWRT